MPFFANKNQIKLKEKRHEILRKRQKITLSVAVTDSRRWQGVLSALMMDRSAFGCVSLMSLQHTSSVNSLQPLAAFISFVPNMFTFDSIIPTHFSNSARIPPILNKSFVSRIPFSAIMWTLRQRMHHQKAARHFGVEVNLRDSKKCFFFLRCLNNGSVVCEKEVGNNSICLHVEFSFSSRRNCFLERNHRTPTTSSILSRLSSRSQSPVIILSVSKPREGNEIRARTKLIMHLVTHFPEQSPRDAFFSFSFDNLSFVSIYSVSFLNFFFLTRLLRKLKTME